MLPFLKPRKQGGVIVAVAKPDGSKEIMGPEDEKDPALLSAAEDLISAINQKDAEMVAEALYAAFVICDMKPHKEGPHE